jgi:hypothetical protein
MVRIFLSDGQKVDVNGKSASDIVNTLNRIAHGGLVLTEIAPGVYVNPNHVTSVFQVGNE